MPTYVIPSFCAAAAIGCTGNPTIPNMNWTPCFLRFLATRVAPSTSAMSSLLSEWGLRSRPAGLESSPRAEIAMMHNDRHMTIATLPLELPIRVAEDAAVLDLMCGGRLEVGVGGGGNLSSYATFGQDSGERATLLVGHLQVLRDAWAGRPLPGGKDQLYPANPSLVERVWQATFTVDGARRAGAAGDGLMLSRTQPRPASAPDLPLAEIQNPMIDAYMEALPG